MAAVSAITRGIITFFLTLSGMENVVVDEGARKPGALFVMGDSYADTGNHNMSDPSLATPWRIPYGETWPQTASGRYCDGRVFTDFYGMANVVVDEGARKSGALFVMGDSYADTGNHNMSDPSLAALWRIPYGETWPQSPSGRSSDGRVFTDFYASFLGVRKPIPYRLIKNTTHGTGKHDHGHGRHMGGINFAFGGSGIFPTFGPQYPNISSQIKQLQHLISRGVVLKELIKASIVLLVVAGNDYTVYSEQHPSYEGILDFIPEVVEEMAASLEELHQVGFRRIAVTNLAPIGCLPGVTFINNFTTCNTTINGWSTLHNTLLASHISALQAKHPSTEFLTLDLHSAFETVMSDAELQLRPCCDGIDDGSCGDVGTNGSPLYSLCQFPNQTLFWDDLHPTDAGWKAVSKALF